MTIEEKAKRYDETLEQLKGLIEVTREDKCDIAEEDIIDIFPELKEYEDERIRKDIIDWFINYKGNVQVDLDDEEVDKWVFWLEKQGEPTDINPSEFDLRLNKLLKQFETLPKEELVNCLSFYLNVVQNDGTYKADEKQGDKDKLIQELGEYKVKYTQEVLSQQLEKQGEQKPIMNVPTREVILAIWDLGNEWKELTNGSISTEYGTQLDYIQKHWHESEYYLKEKQGEQKPAEWSEDDKDYYDAIITKLEVTKDDALLTDNQMEFLKSLKDRVQPKQEWSEEDESTIKDIIEDLEYAEAKGYVLKNNTFLKEINWLKSLRPQPKKEWNEEDERMFEQILQQFMTANNDCKLYNASFTYDKEISFLKSLKDRVQPKQEWSEEDIRNIDDIDSVLFYDKDLPEDTCVRLRNWLKSLRPQNRWKPTEEQMEALHDLNLTGNISYAGQGQVLIELYNDLKKLKE